MRHRSSYATRAVPSGRGVVADRALPAGRPIDVAVAIQPALFSDVLSCALGRLPGIRVAMGGAGEGRIDRLLKLKPRVLLLDDEGLGRDACRVIRQLRRVAPGTRTLVMSTQTGGKTSRAVMSAGASGVVEKRTGLDTLARAIHAVAEGGVWNSPGADGTTAEEPRARASRSSPLESLTRREIEIAKSVAQGLRNKEIALRLKISEETVKTHLHNIFSKLDLESRTALGILAKSISARTDS